MNSGFSAGLTGTNSKLKFIGIYFLGIKWLAPIRS